MIRWERVWETLIFMLGIIYATFFMEDWGDVIAFGIGFVGTGILIGHYTRRRYDA